MVKIMVPHSRLEKGVLVADSSGSYGQMEDMLAALIQSNPC
jgi:hypothetical protein